MHARGPRGWGSGSGSQPTLANLLPARSLASKFCWSMTSQLAVVPTHTRAQKIQIGMSKGRRKAG